MADRIGLLISALGVLVGGLLFTGALQAYLSGESAWWVGWACLLQVATVQQLLRGFRRRRTARGEAG